MSLLKRQRVANIFVDTAIKQITENGVNDLSVRKIALESGFSYATLYNYFEDFNALLWVCKKQMIKALVETMTSIEYDASAQGVRLLFKNYVNYFLDNPHIFHFFYFYPVKAGIEAFDEFGFDALMFQTFNYLRPSKDDETIKKIASSSIYAVHGILMLHFSGNDQADSARIEQEVDACLDVLLQ